ncbi:hypothetical protein [Actimicrobium antarcticum]|uniref:Uncharacterized protein n=1 Tax=Actimicrobium antarcticum TaxID=1051899 RepID=A0ABP7TKF3_9BURK
MNKLSLAILLSLAGMAGFANAQSGITESTDPAKIAAIEQRARELGQVQPAVEAGKPMPAMHHGDRHHEKKHHGMKHHGDKRHGMMHPPGHGERAVPVAPSAPMAPAPGK